MSWWTSCCSQVIGFGSLLYRNISNKHCSFQVFTLNPSHVFCLLQGHVPGSLMGTFYIHWVKRVFKALRTLFTIFKYLLFSPLMNFNNVCYVKWTFYFHILLSEIVFPWTKCKYKIGNGHHLIDSYGVCMWKRCKNAHDKNSK